MKILLQRKVYEKKLVVAYTVRDFKLETLV